MKKAKLFVVILLAVLALFLIGCNTTKDNETTGTTYKVIFQQDGCDPIEKTVKEGEDLKDIPTPVEVVGYTVTWDVTDFTNIRKDMTVQAVKKANSYTVTYDPAGGTVSGEKDTFVYDGSYTLKTPVNSDATKVFVGWKNGDQLVELTGTWSIAQDVTLKAVWETKKCTITYKLGSLEDKKWAVSIPGYEQTAEPGSTVQLYVPSCSGYVFKGWKNAKTGEMIGDGTFNLMEDVELVAVWSVDNAGDDDWTDRH